MSTAAQHDDALKDFAVSFKAAMAALRRLRGRDTQRAGELSYAQYGLLFGLADESALSIRELATAAELSPATATQMLDSLEDAGLVARVRSATDKRVVLVSLTDRGRELTAARRAHFEPRWRSALAEFSREELATAATVLDRLRLVFDDFAEYPDEIAQENSGASITSSAAHASAADAYVPKHSTPSGSSS
jgi:DNA-binding MarR family transcriptional regulator